MYQRKLEKSVTTPVNIPRKNKFIDSSNRVFRRGYKDPNWFEPVAAHGHTLLSGSVLIWHDAVLLHRAHPIRAALG
jgi:hypothetical protein